MTVNRELQQSAGAKPGDIVDLVLALDGASRSVTVPPDLEQTLTASAKAKALWDDITPRAREEWVTWIESAKKGDTRARRIEQVVTRLEAGKPRVYQ